MLAITAAMLFAATVTHSDTLEDNQPASEVDIVFETAMEVSQETDEIVFDDSLLDEADSELLELEE